MSHTNVASWALADYERAAADYCASLPLEHFMESIGQATQRKVSWVSLDLIAARRGNVQVFNELLIQYPFNGGLGQVVPDNMVVRGKRKLKTGGSYNIAFESARPFWVLEYVSKSNKSKDYEDSFFKYEQELQVPYYLIFDPDTQELVLYRHDGARYRAVGPNEHGRLGVPELGVEVALLDGWARFWHRGDLVPLPDDLQREVDDLREQLDEARTQAVRQKRRADREKRRADEEKRRADEQGRRADEQGRRADAAEEELKRLRALLERRNGGAPGGTGTNR